MLALCLAVVCLAAAPCAAIINGDEASIVDYPWSARLEKEAGEGSNAGWFFVCSASMLNPYWALTHFNCLRAGGEERDTRTTPKLADFPMRVSYGASRFALSPGENSPDDDRFVKRVGKIHQNATHFPGLALLQLAQNISRFANYTNATVDGGDWPIVAGVDIADQPPVDGELLSIAGWGAVQTNGLVVSRVLRAFSAPYNANASCGLQLGQNASRFCFGVPAPAVPVRDACAADYGAALVNSRGQQVALYHRSNGDELSVKNCKGEGIYLRVDVAKQWIDSLASNLTVHAAAAALLPAPLSALLAVVAVLAALL